MSWSGSMLILTVLLAFGVLSCTESNSELPAPKKTGVEQVAYDSEKNPGLRAVGKITNGQRTCSLVLVSQDIAVTAGHFLNSAPIIKHGKLVKTKKYSILQTKVIFKSKDDQIIELTG